jgi:hypothetical protein
VGGTGAAGLVGCSCGSAGCSGSIRRSAREISSSISDVSDGSTDSAGATVGVPHFGQNAAPSRSACPHFLQNISLTLLFELLCLLCDNFRLNATTIQIFA